MALETIVNGSKLDGLICGQEEYSLDAEKRLVVRLATVVTQTLDGKADLVNHLKALRDKKAFVQAQIDRLVALKAAFDSIPK